MAAAFAAAAVPLDRDDANAGVTILELQRDEDVRETQVALARDPNVQFVARVPIRYLVAKGRPPREQGRTRARRPGIAAVPPAASTMWNLSKIKWAEARARQGFKDATNVRVAVLDTGIDQDHPDLAGRVAGYTFDHPDSPDASSAQDIVGHGTHVAGTIAAVMNNELGINGICDCQLHAWKIFDDVADFASWENNFQYFVDPVMYLRALADCIEQRVDVVNLSIGGGGEPDGQERALFQILLAQGTVVVAAMGNERQLGSPTSYPAAIDGVIAVGATSLDDSVADFSNRGNHIAISAPGVAIWSTLPTYEGQFGFEAVTGPGGNAVEGRRFRRETDYDAWPGTSMASPHAAAAVALLLANKDSLSPDAVRQRLAATADKVPEMNGADHHADYGAGRLNLFRLLGS